MFMKEIYAHDSMLEIRSRVPYEFVCTLDTRASQWVVAQTQGISKVQSRREEKAASKG